MHPSTRLYPVLLCLSCCLGQYQMLNGSVIDMIPDFLGKLCPDANVCRRNFSRTAFFTSPLRSCCTECSCDPGCGKYERCCFENSDFDDSDENTEMSIPKIRRVKACLYSQTTAPTDTRYVYSFYMISSVVYSSSENKTTPCGIKNVAPWGNLWPVYSGETGKIYKNRECANEDNVTDGVLWDAYLVCNSKTSQDVTNAFLGLVTGVLPSHCHVLFIYPGDFDDIRPSICFSDIIDHCSAADFDIPASINATKGDIDRACRSGLLAPYIIPDNRYANVFCYICSGLVFQESLKCFYPTVTEKGPEHFDFSALVDSQTLKQGPSEKRELSTYGMMAVCPNTRERIIDGIACRPTFCSSGQVLIMQKCSFPTKIWFTKMYTVVLRLEIDIEVNATEIFQFHPGTYFQTDSSKLSSLISPWPDSWTVVQAICEINSSKKISKALVVRLSRKSQQVRPKSLLKQIGRLLSTDWNLIYRNETRVMKSSPFRADVLISADNPQILYRTGAFNKNGTNMLPTSVYRLMYDSLELGSYSIRVTKLFFCPQVELLPGEFELSDDESALFNKVSGKFLYDAEFIVMRGDANTTVMLCLEDSGFRQSPYSYNSAQIYLHFLSMSVSVLIAVFCTK